MTSRVTHVGQGDVIVGNDPRDCLTTILGSCVAICLYDPLSGAGGMVHFRLPFPPCPDVAPSARALYGPAALELLHERLTSIGAQDANLHAKLFGGGAVVDRLGDIGDQNVRFALRGISDLGIPLVSQDLGGTAARRVRFMPTTGHARVQRVPVDSPPVQRATTLA